MSETQTYKGYTIKIEQDQDPMDPRDNDNLGTMVCFHRRYSLGDPKKHGYKNVIEFKKWFEAHQEGLISLPVYMYDHSGITINTTGYSHIDSAQWDWGQLGVIYVSRETVKKEYGWKSISKAREEKVREHLRAEVEEYDHYLTGAAYGYTIQAPDGTDVEDGSCWGFLGSDHEKSGLLEQARAAVDAEIQRVLKHEGVQQALQLA